MQNTETITLWHHYTGPDGEIRWARYVLLGTWYQHTKSAPSQGGLLSANLLKIRIPYGTGFVEPTAWSEIQKKEPTTQPALWTVAKGDIVARGNIAARPKGTEPGLATVTGMGDNRKGGLPHIYVEAT